jgi:hypothetical protein
MANKFRGPESQDFTIVDDDGVVGHIRVKPSGVLWAPKNSQTWHRLSLERFAELATKHGAEQDR